MNAIDLVNIQFLFFEFELFSLIDMDECEHILLSFQELFKKKALKRMKFEKYE